MKKPFNRKNSMFCIEYWLSRGYSEEQGRLEIKKKQSRGRSFFKTEEEYQSYLKKHRLARSSEKFKKNAREGQKRGNTLERYIERLGEKRGREEFEKSRRRKSKTASDNLSKRTSQQVRESSSRCVEYWTKRGYDLDEANILVSSFQARGKSFYVKKYGEIEGTKKWTDRNTRWSKTMASLDQDKLNEKRSKNSHCGIFTEKTIKKRGISELTFYVLHFTSDGEEFLKFGLTSRRTKDRWSSSLPYEVVIEKKVDALRALDIENSIKKRFKDELYRPMIIRTREAVLGNSSHPLVSYAEKLLEERTS